MQNTKKARNRIELARFNLDEAARVWAAEDLLSGRGHPQETRAWNAYMQGSREYYVQYLGMRQTGMADEPGRAKGETTMVPRAEALVAAEADLRDLQELDRIAAECGCDLGDDYGHLTGRERAQRLLDCADPPRGGDHALCIRVTLT